MNTPKINGLTFLSTITPDAAFETWRLNEADNPGWQQSALDHGYDSWEAWRRHRFELLGGNNPVWWRFRVDEPLKTVPGFFGGPSKTWIRLHYDKQALVRFGDFATPEQFADNNKVSSLLRNFPAETEITGLLTSNGEIVIIEGTHRCTALAIAGKTAQTIDADVVIALTRWDKDDFPIPDPDPDGPTRVRLAP